jgi:hypothetical protein
MDNLEENKNLALDKIAELISLSIRSLKDKNERLEFFKNMKKVPSKRELKRVNEIAIQKEDYETCDAIKEFCEYKGIVLN